MEVAEFNALTADGASALVAGCLGVPRWGDDLVAARPYADLPALRQQASDGAAELSDDELASALARHPRIGERATGDGSEARFSQAEQSGVEASDEQRLRDGNATYEDRFGHVFLIRAAGRSSGEILSELERRLGNDHATERAETVSALRDIALLRLDQVVG